MNYLNITKYIYLAVGFVMVYYAIADWNNNTDEAYLCLIVAGLAFFTFFFRMRFAKKFENRKNNNQPK